MALYLKYLSRTSDVVYLGGPSCGTKDDPVPQMVWGIIAIPVAPLRNRLKEDVIEACECLNAWYI